MISISSDHTIFSWNYENYEYFSSVETYDILMATQNSILFEIMIQEFDTLFDYTFQERPKINHPNINIVQSEHGISTDHTDHIIKNIIQYYK